MKYLILLIVSLFCLTSFSEHKKDPVTEEDLARYEELQNKRNKTDKEKKEYESLKFKKYFKGKQILSHFGGYIGAEFSFYKAERGNADSQFSLYVYFKRLHFDSYFKDYTYTNLDEVPNCTKERLEKYECPRPPYTAIYWAKRLLYEGTCVFSGTFALYKLMNDYVIPKTNIRDQKSLFYTFYYIAAYFKQEQEIFDFLTEIEYKKELASGTLSEATKKALKKDIQEIEEKINKAKNRTEKIKQNLSEKDQKLADEKINDLIKKWSEKWGKDQIYRCSRSKTPSKARKSDVEFLEEYYPNQ